ncbi:hypothetical protein [Paenibacillus sp. YYML68]|uniref:hypothetical protein n=1 Tax=Paenibacillus sp. YYML68 TaxID=2909250 RepID=UPI0024909F9A|nr:hypothetical protein [Paenibacillus sp. YYML68]
MPANTYYIIYDEFSISICTVLDDVCDAIAGGAQLYGYTDDEAMAQLLLKECFQIVERNS